MLKAPRREKPDLIGARANKNAADEIMIEKSTINLNIDLLKVNRIDQE